MGSAVADTPSSNSRMQMTHVCHHWRVIALRTPGLWTTLAIPGFDSSSYVRHFLPRSGTLPLRISLTVGGTLAALPDIDIIGDRIQELDVTPDESCGEEVWNAAIFARPAPALTSLILDHVSKSHLPHGGRLPLLFCGKAPLLRYLRLSGPTRWRNDFRDLTSLHLDSQDYYGNNRMSIEELLAFLALSPHLEELTLADAALESPDSDIQPTNEIAPERQVSLPRLRSLRVGGGTYADAFGVEDIRQIVRPLGISVHCSREHWGPGILKSRWNYWDLPPTTIRRVMFSAHSPPETSRFESDYNDVLAFEGDSLDITIGDGTWGGTDDMFGSFLPRWRSSFASVTRVEIKDVQAPDDWNILFQHFPDLETLKLGDQLDYCPLVDFLLALESEHVRLESIILPYFDPRRAKTRVPKDRVKRMEDIEKEQVVVLERPHSLQPICQLMFYALEETEI